MYVASQKRIRHEGIYYDAAHEAICLETLRKLGVSVRRATTLDTITTKDGIPAWEPDLVSAGTTWGGSTRSPMTHYIECKDWDLPQTPIPPYEATQAMRRSAAWDVFPLILFPRRPKGDPCGAIWWGWVRKPETKRWEHILFSRGENVVDAYTEACQKVAPAKRYRRWEAREQMRLPLRRRHLATTEDQNRRLPSRS